MANRVEAPTLLVPAGTPASAPVSVLLYAERAVLVQLDVMVPPGPSGLVGFSVWHSNAQIIPKTVGQWIVADGETISLPLDGFSPWPDWRLRAYNLDVYPHTLYARVLLDDNTTVPAGTVALVAIE